MLVRLRVADGTMGRVRLSGRHLVGLVVSKITDHPRLPASQILSSPKAPNPLATGAVRELHVAFTDVRSVESGDDYGR